MPMPLWWGKVNKRIFNPMELKKGKRPVLTHVGRTSGTEYRTPLDAHRVEGGFLFILVYGSRSDWVRNVLASGNAELTVDSATHALTRPRVIGPDDAWAMLPEGMKRPAEFLNVNEFLVMDVG